MLEEIFLLFPHSVANNFCGPDTPLVSRSSPARCTFVANYFHCSPNVSQTFEPAAPPTVSSERMNEVRRGAQRYA